MNKVQTYSAMFWVSRLIAFGSLALVIVASVADIHLGLKIVTWIGTAWGISISLEIAENYGFRQGKKYGR